MRRLAQCQTAGWLGSTSGVAADGTYIAVVRFESEAAAQANSERPEQGQWWEQQCSAAFEGEPTFLNSSEVAIQAVGDFSQAGFVQIIQGRNRDFKRSVELMNGDFDMSQLRPDVLGSTLAAHDGGKYTMTIYFTSEADAREGEKREMPAEMADVMAEMGELEIGEPTFIDLREPVLMNP